MAIISPIKYVPANEIGMDGETTQLPGTCNYGDCLGFLIPLIVSHSGNMSSNVSSNIVAAGSTNSHGDDADDEKGGERILT